MPQDGHDQTIHILNYRAKFANIAIGITHYMNAVGA